MATHTPPHSCVAAGHTHWPATQLVPPVQETPQAPQFLPSLLVSVQVAPQAVWLAAQVVAHLPSEHLCPSAHALPQAPQFAGSLCASTHVPAHNIRPLAQAHFPDMQVVPPPQAFPQVPQLSPPLLRSTQAPLQLERPAAQLVVHAPALHTRPGPQVVPQPPQLRTSLASETHVVPQAVSPEGQTQAPPLQIIPPPHGWPQAPQSSTSDVSATHARPHDVRPDAHADVQTPRSHTSLAAQARPQAPQFETFEVRSTQTPPHEVVVSVQIEIVHAAGAQFAAVRPGLTEMSASPGAPLAASGASDAVVTEPQPSPAIMKPTRIQVRKLMDENLVPFSGWAIGQSEQSQTLPAVHSRSTARIRRSHGASCPRCTGRSFVRAGPRQGRPTSAPMPRRQPRIRRDPSGPRPVRRPFSRKGCTSMGRR